MNITCPWMNNSVQYKLPDGWLDLVVLYYVSAASLAIAGNFLVMLTVIRRPLLHRVSYYLVAALALEDLLQGTIVGTARSLANINGCWPLGGVTCVLFGYLTTCLVGVEFLLLVAITINRYIACCFSLKYAVLVTHRRCKSVIAGCWIYPAMTAILPLIGFNSYRYVVHLHTCELELSSRPLSLGCMGTLTGTTFVPCTVVMVVCQIKIYKQVKKVTDQPLPQIARSETSPAIVMASSRPTKAALTVSLVTGIYFICWVPYLGLRVMLLFGVAQNNVGMNNLEIANVCLVMVSKFVNPFVYGVYNREFRREFFKLCRQ